jgi:hypothetical protein
MKHEGPDRDLLTRLQRISAQYCLQEGGYVSGVK